MRFWWGNVTVFGVSIQTGSVCPFSREKQLLFVLGVVP